LSQPASPNQHAPVTGPLSTAVAYLPLSIVCPSHDVLPASYSIEHTLTLDSTGLLTNSKFDSCAFNFVINSKS